MGFDPNAAARPGSGVFGLPCGRVESRVVLIPVPFDATTSYRAGTAGGPGAILEASGQVDLFDVSLGRVYERGIFMEPIPGAIRALSRSARAKASPVIARGGARAGSASDAKALAAVARAGERVNEFVYGRASAALSEGRVPGVVGGEHSVPYGSIRACAERFPGLGILQVDAHMDFREAFEGFAWSHASIMHNVMTRVGGVSRVVQVGIRDFGEDEMSFARGLGERCRVYFDETLAGEMLSGGAWGEACRRIVGDLPGEVYVTVDIDALDPSLCPNTGTPVPGGLSYAQLRMLLLALRGSGRRVVGFDVVEVTPGRGSIDANVGARVLYTLCGLA
ncbi:MAG: agmatinase family protein [Phycisphaeraceae bacterium]|nr:MAG: agmatinase family protein [Phycisphaeraceae bacterium]